jgi:hypothetical protein
MTDDFVFKDIDAQLAAGLSRRFRLIRQLGAGGMGAVILVESANQNGGRWATVRWRSRS